MSGNREPDGGDRDGARLAGQRRRARRTALVVALVAVAVYVLFLLSGVLSK